MEKREKENSLQVYTEKIFMSVLYAIKLMTMHDGTKQKTLNEAKWQTFLLLICFMKC